MDNSLPGEIRSDLSLPYSVIPPLFTIKYVTLTPQGKDEGKKTRNATSEGFPPPQRECQGQGRCTRVPQHMLLATCLGQTLACDWWLLMVSPYTPSARKEFPKRFRGNSLRHWVIPLRRSRHGVTSEENFLSLSLFNSYFNPGSFAFQVCFRNLSFPCFWVYAEVEFYASRRELMNHGKYNRQRIGMFFNSSFFCINWIRLVSYMDYFFNNREGYVGNKNCKTATS